MEITEKILGDKVVGYVCDICNTNIVFKHVDFPQKNILTWSHPSGAWGESTGEESINFCSMKCLLKALRKVYYGANIELSSDFLENWRTNGL